MPAVSVVLPIYNGRQYLERAIGSILDQTITDIELILVDDRSSDDSLEIASTFADPRVTIIRNQVNMGLAASLDLGIESSSSSLIARQDQDDWAAPNRLARQIEFLNENRDVGLVGTWAQVIAVGDQDSSTVIHEHRHPTDDAELRWRLLWNSPFVHSSIMMRRDLVRRAGGYSAGGSQHFPEDYSLWVRMAGICALANIPEFLQVYRQTPSGLSRTLRAEIARGVEQISCACISALLPDVCQEDVVGLSRALNGQEQPRTSARTLVRRVRLFHAVSRSVLGFHIANHFRSYAFALLRLLRNSFTVSSKADS